jgi:hypothetical protein
MYILSEDFIKSATLTNADSLTLASGHPLTNVQDSRLSRNAWILPATLHGDLYGVSMYGENPYYDEYETATVDIDFNLRASKTFDTFALGGNNFGTIDLTLSWAAVDIDTPDGSISFTHSGPMSTVVIPTGTVTARYFRVAIGSSLPDGNYLVIGRIMLGNRVSLPGIRTIFDIDHVSTANRSFSDSRQLYGGPKVIYRKLNVTFPDIADPAELVDIFTTVDLYNPFFLAWDEECMETQENMYCAWTDDALPFNHNDARRYTSRATFTEVF